MIRLLVLSCVIFTASALSFKSIGNFVKSTYSDIIQFPDALGNVFDVDLKAPINYEVLNKIELDDNSNEYWLYTRNNPDTPQKLRINDAESVRNSNFDPNKETVFIVHGWQNRASTEPNVSFKPVFLQKADVNVICVDWSLVSMNNFPTASFAAPSVGRKIGRFINYLANEHKLNYDTTHLVGYSLGAHVVGNAGRETGGRVARITSLDPAGPLWNVNSDKIVATDAVYVETILTDAVLSLYADSGDVEFYVNGGMQQPGCAFGDVYCNHGVAWQVFASSITHDHLIGRRCKNPILRQLNKCKGEELVMGTMLLRKNAKPGKYRVNTKTTYPY